MQITRIIHATFIYNFNVNDWIYWLGGSTAEDQMSMRAKINFYASKVGDHPNILHFAGAVLDDESRIYDLFSNYSLQLILHHTQL